MIRWKKIFDGKFVINEYGEVRCAKTGKMRKPYVHQNRNIFYLRYYVNGRKWFVHVLNYISWVGPIPEGFQVGHKKNNTFDNYWKNLEAQSPEQNRNERRKYNSWKEAL